MLETIYTDFTTKLLPKIAEGLTITKDYFMDLFGRYAKFLFIRDLIYTVLCFFGVLVIGYVIYRLLKYQKSIYNQYDLPIYGLFGVILLIPVGFMIGGFIQYGTYTIQDAYVPEIRIYQEIRGYISTTQH